MARPVVARATLSGRADPAPDPARSAALVEAIAARINDGSARPVILFLPQVPSLRQLSKGDPAKV